MKCCIFGSFDPLTIGHEYIINESAKIFDVVYLLVIKNNKFKIRHFDYDLCLNSIKDTFKNSTNIKIIEFDGEESIEQFLKTNNCDYLVRGIRNKKDFEFEEFVYKRKFSSFVKVMYIKSPFKKVSSSKVYKDFLKHKIDKNFLSKNVYEILCNKLND